MILLHRLKSVSFPSLNYSTGDIENDYFVDKNILLYFSINISWIFT